MVDHKDRDPMNDRIENLRLATAWQNQLNKRKTKKNKSGYKGVCKTRGGRWVASITIDYKPTRLGTFDDPAEAHAAYVAAAKARDSEFAFDGKDQ